MRLPDTHSELAFQLILLFSLKLKVPRVIFNKAKIKDIVQTDTVETAIRLSKKK